MNRFRTYCYTLNNPKEEYDSSDMEKDKIIYILYSHEKGKKEGTFHHQGYVRFKNPRTLNGVKRIKYFSKAHLERARGNFSQNYKYITKDDNENIFEYGKQPKQGERTDLEKTKIAITTTDISKDDVYLEYYKTAARCPKYIDSLYNIMNKKKAKENYKLMVEGKLKKIVMVIIGKPGSGKTSYVYKNHDIDDIYKLNFGDGSQSSLWFDGYNNENILLIDDFYGNIKYSLMLRILDIYPLRVQKKGGYEYVNFTKIYITSNKPPSEWYKITDISALQRRITYKIKKHKGADIVLPATSVHLTNVGDRSRFAKINEQIDYNIESLDTKE